MRTSLVVVAVGLLGCSDGTEAHPDASAVSPDAAVAIPGEMASVDGDGASNVDLAPVVNSIGGVVLADDASIFYSPGNWAPVGTGMSSVNAGAYFRTIFSGTTCKLGFDVTSDGMPLSEVWVTVDGATPVKSNIAAALDCTPTTAQPEHTVELVIKSTSQNLPRWTMPQTVVALTQLQLDVGAYTRAPSVLPCRGIFFGDSITEGINTTPGAGGENDQGDATLGWAYLQKGLLGCEIGVVGFGFQGFSHIGNGNVPLFGDAWPYVFSTLPRSFSDVDFVVVNQGTNDGTNDETALERTFLGGILAATAQMDPIVILRPFDGAQATNWQNTIAAVGNARVRYVDTTGFFDTSESVDGVHPNAAADAQIAPLIAAQIKPVLP